MSLLRLRCYPNVINENIRAKILNDLPISWIEYLEFLPKSRAIYVCVVCNQCKVSCLINSKQLSKRSVKEEICNKCILKYITNTTEWKSKNSKAQLKIQSTAEQKKKNADGVSNFWKNNPEAKKKMAEKVRFTWGLVETKAKHLYSNRGIRALAGSLFINNTWVAFQSSYELCFLLWLRSLNVSFIIRKCNFLIPYFYNQERRHYIPDYVLYIHNQKVLVEVKSTKYPNFNLEKQNAKNVAALDFIKKSDIDSFWYLYDESGQEIGINFKRSTGIKKICKDLYSQGLLRINNKDQQKRYIGISDENKEQENRELSRNCL